MSRQPQVLLDLNVPVSWSRWAGRTMGYRRQAAVSGLRSSLTSRLRTETAWGPLGESSTT